MSSDKEKVNQQLQAERDKVDARNREIELNHQAEERERNALQADKDETAEQSEETQFQVRSSAVGQNDWKKVVEDYKKQHPDTPVTNNTLRFPTKEDAIQFFTAQATSTPPRKFFASAIGPDGKLTDDNVLSCGDGKLYKGTLLEIQADLQAALKANPNDPNIKEGLGVVTQAINPAQGYKQRLQNTKKDTSQELVEENSAPNPLSTKP